MGGRLETLEHRAGNFRDDAVHGVRKSAPVRFKPRFFFCPKFEEAARSRDFVEFFQLPGIFRREEPVRDIKGVRNRSDQFDIDAAGNTAGDDARRPIYRVREIELDP